MKKARLGLVLGVLFAIGLCSISFGQINPECPNGCLDKLGQCYCYGTHAFKEAVWDQKN